MNLQEINSLFKELQTAGLTFDPMSSLDAKVLKAGDIIYFGVEYKLNKYDLAETQVVKIDGRGIIKTTAEIDFFTNAAYAGSVVKHEPSNIKYSLFLPTHCEQRIVEKLERLDFIKKRRSQTPLNKFGFIPLTFSQKQI